MTGSSVCRGRTLEELNDHNKNKGKWRGLSDIIKRLQWEKKNERDKHLIEWKKRKRKKNIYE